MGRYIIIQHHTYQPVTLAKSEIHVKKRVISTKKSDIRIAYKRCLICYTSRLCLCFLKFLAQNMDVNFTHAHGYILRFVQYVLPVRWSDECLRRGACVAEARLA